MLSKPYDKSTEPPFNISNAIYHIDHWAIIQQKDTVTGLSNKCMKVNDKDKLCGDITIHGKCFALAIVLAAACLTDKKLSLILQIYAIFTKNYKFTLNPKALYYA